MNSRITLCFPINVSIIQINRTSFYFLKINLDIVAVWTYFILHMTRARKPDRKLTVLKQSGTVNPHAQDVQDPAFIDSDFFDPRDLVQVRYEMLRRVRTEGCAIADTASRFGVSRPTFYKAQTDFERSGLAGLLPVKRGPHGPHKITDEVMSFIEAERGLQEDWDVNKLVERIAQRFGLMVHRRTVERALARLKKKR